MPVSPRSGFGVPLVLSVRGGGDLQATSDAASKASSIAPAIRLVMETIFASRGP
jgi:hypothetical protein